MNMTDQLLALTGWIVTFIINERGGGPASGYISSGFFGGLMLGRVVLLWINKKIGERSVVFVYAALAITRVSSICCSPITEVITTDSRW
jgi:fucose permease